MSTNVATNIRLPEEVLKTLKYRAIEERKSVNQLIREALDAFLSGPDRSAVPERDPFEAVIGIARSGIKDGAVKHDAYLYRKKR